MAKKKKQAEFSFDFSALTFGRPAEDDDQEEIPKLSTEPAAFENAEAMVDEIDYKKDYFCFVPGNFIFGDFLEALVYKKRLAPSEAYITTLGMSQDNIDSIVNLVDYLRLQKSQFGCLSLFRGSREKQVDSIYAPRVFRKTDRCRSPAITLQDSVDFFG